MAAEIISILDAEGIDKVHAVGHDTGCTLLSRLADYFPERLLSCVFLDVPYMRPGERFDLDMVNRVTRDILGFERFGYVGFFAGKGSGGLLDRFVGFSSFLFFAFFFLLVLVLVLVLHSIRADDLYERKDCKLINDDRLIHSSPSSTPTHPHHGSRTSAQQEQ